MCAVQVVNAGSQESAVGIRECDTAMKSDYQTASGQYMVVQPSWHALFTDVVASQRVTGDIKLHRFIGITRMSFVPTVYAAQSQSTTDVCLRTAQ